jgi:hypothetical protein
MGPCVGGPSGCSQGFKKYNFQQNLFKVLRDTINIEDNDSKMDKYDDQWEIPCAFPHVM